MSHWSVVGYGSHPIPGDPSAVRSHAAYYGRVAEAISDTASNLRSTVTSTDVESQAIAEFKELALEVASSVNEIDERYDVVSRALTTYAVTLEETRSEAAAAVATAHDAEGDRQNAAWRESQLRAQIMDPSTPPANLPALQQALDYAEYEQAYASQRISSAAQTIQDLVARRAAAAEVAATTIRECISGAALNDSWWDKVVDVVNAINEVFLDAVEWFLEALEAILPILDVLLFIATIVAWVLILTGVGAAVGAIILLVAGAIAVALSAIKFQATLILAVGGRRSWVDVGFAALELGITTALFVVGQGGGAATVKSLGEVAYDFLVKDRVEEFVTSDLVEYTEDFVNGEGLPSLAEVAYDAVLLEPEQTMLEAAADFSLPLAAAGADLAGNAVGAIGDGLGDAYTAVADVASAPAEFASEVLPGGLGEIAGGVDQVIDGVGQVGADVAGAVGDAGESVLHGAADVARGVSGVIQTVSGGGS